MSTALLTPRAELVDRYDRGRARSRALFDLVDDEAYYSRPIALRHPIVFYEGHLPAFSFNTLLKKGLGKQSIDPRLEALFARGIDPDEQTAGKAGGQKAAGQEGKAGRLEGWPDRSEVHAFADEADRLVIDALLREDLERPGDPLLDRAEAVYTILEHEAMHQETLLYMWHRLPFADKHKPSGYAPQTAGVSPSAEWVDVPAG